MAKNAFTHLEALNLGLDLCSALAVCRQSGYLYVDLKPSNVYVSENGLIYVQVPEGKYFCMGDNRGHSDDSRKNGFYDVEYIVGRVEFIVYDHNFGNRLWEVVKYYFGQVEEFFAR